MSQRTRSSFGLGSGHENRARRAPSRRRRSRYPSYRSRSRRSEVRRRRAALALVLLAVVVVVVAVRVATETVPGPTATAVAPADAIVAGQAPAPPWPAEGQAAFAVPGVVAESSPKERPTQIASVAKVMTAYVLLHDHPLAAGATGIMATVTAADVADYQTRLSQAESVVPVVAGERLSEQQLLEGLLIPSGNNYADIIAELDAGSTSAFVAKMNADAKALGMTATTYTVPSGYSPITLSTARDQTVLASAAMGSPAFAAIVAMHLVTLPDAGEVANYDTLVGSDGFIGIKTGSDTEAGGCFMFAATRSAGTLHFTVYGTVLGLAYGTDITATLVDAAQTASRQVADSVPGGVRAATVLAPGTTAVRITNAAGRHVDAVTTSALAKTAWAGSKVPLSVAVRPLGSTVAAGQTVATVTAPGGPTTTVTTQAALPAPGLAYRLEHIL